MLKRYWKFPRARKRGMGALGVFWLVLPPVGAVAAEAIAESPPNAVAADAVAEPPPNAVAAEAIAEPPPKSVTLDQLLTLPSALPIESGERGGVTRAEWSSRFADADAEVIAAQADLDESLDKLSELVGKTSNWKVAAPGGQAAAPSENSTVNYGLKQEIRRKREDVERAERKARDLIVEANLAGVPEDWHTKLDPTEQ